MHIHRIIHPVTNIGSGASVPLQSIAQPSQSTEKKDHDAAGAGHGNDGESDVSGMDSGDAAAASAGDLAFALRTVAEARKSQQKMQSHLRERLTKEPGRSRVLSTVRLPEFDGHPNTSVRQHREWKKYLDAIKFVNKLSDQESALNLFSSAQHRAKVLLECLGLPDVRNEQGLQHI